MMQELKNGRSFNSKFESYLKWNLKARSPGWHVDNNILQKWFAFPSSKVIQKWEEDKNFQDFPENSTFEIEGALKTNKPLLFWAKPMNLKLIKGK